MNARPHVSGPSWGIRDSPSEAGCSPISATWWKCGSVRVSRHVGPCRDQTSPGTQANAGCTETGFMLTFTDVTKRYASTVAVDGLSLEIKRGEIFGLLGPNGAGKSTTVHLAVGLLAPDAGKVAVAGAGSPEQPSVRTRIGVAPQAL